jgi:hypothetical protein
MTLLSIILPMVLLLRKFKVTFINYFQLLRLKLIILLVGTNYSPERISFLIYDSLVTKKYGKNIDKHTFIMQNGSLNNLLDAFDSAEPVSIDNDTNSKFLASKLSQEDFLKLNENNLYRDSQGLSSAVNNFCQENMQVLNNVIKSPFRIINIRAWETKTTATEFGPTKYHKDGFLEGHMKIMLYLTELSENGGSIQFLNEEPLEAPAGLVLIFKNSDLTHRAISGKINDRKLIELTLQRCLEQVPWKITTGKLNDRHHLAPWLHQYE